MNRVNFYIGALLHDIGKFAQRANAFPAKDFDKDQSKYAHAAFSAQFIKKMIDQGHTLGNNEALNIALFHHVNLLKGKSTGEESDKFISLVRLADWLSSSERTENEKIDTDSKFASTPLISVFSRLFDWKEDISGKAKKETFKLQPLNLQKQHIFPKGKAVLSPNEYKVLFNKFTQELSAAKNVDQLYYLLEKYTWCIPSATPWGSVHTIPDVSLFDHSRTTAAIALCLFDELKEGKISSYILAAEKIDDLPDEKHFVLALIDFSGIQDFIYSISSKKAARSLKGRSLFLDLFSEVVARFFVRQLDLTTANILYNGGGNFYLLLPKVKKPQLNAIYQYVSNWTLKSFHGKIYLALGEVDLSFTDFKDISQKWREVNFAAGQRKSKRYEEIDYEEVFQPFGGESSRECSVCHSESKKLENLDEETSWCPMCQSLESLAREIQQKKRIAFIQQEIDISHWQSLTFPADGTYQDFFKGLGFKLYFTDSRVDEGTKFFTINDTEFLQASADGFKFEVVQLPMAKNSFLMFDQIAEFSESKTGTKKLALLKMDVDNLGKIFDSGFEEKDRTISRIASLSWQLRMFFEGYLNTILSTSLYKNKIYTIYSGGDDSFFIGPWHLMFRFAREIHEHFVEYVCENQGVTLSASLTVIDEKFPVIRAARMAESALEQAKHARPEKNRISIFGYVFTWREFEFIERLKSKIVELIKEKGESRGLLQKIMNSTRGFSGLLNFAGRGMIPTERLWRFAYYLRTVDKKNKEKAEELLKIYEDILISRLFDNEKIESIMIIPVACRWAELETRNITKSNRKEERLQDELAIE